jgi:hypothetical protein
MSATSSPAGSHAESVRTLAAAMLRTAVIPGLVTVAVAAAVATAAAGSAGLYGALVGGGVAFGSSLVTIALMRWSADLPVMVVMTVALGGFVFKIMMLLVVMLALRDVAALHGRSLALTFLATVLVWAAAEAVAFKRTRIPTLIVGGE